MRTNRPSSVKVDWTNRGRPWQRRCRLVIYVTDSELADVHQLAEAWGCKASAAAWGILAERLARYRRQGARLGPHGLALAALAGTLRLPVDWRRWRGPHGVAAGLDPGPAADDA